MLGKSLTPRYQVSIPFRVLVGFLRDGAPPSSTSVHRVSIPFRVLVGFLLPPKPRKIVFTIPVSIPFRVLVGFLPFWERGTISWSPQTGVSIPFRVLVGFLLVARAVAEACPGRVSIPFRVLVGFLRLGMVPRGVGENKFQSLSGFWWGFCRSRDGRKVDEGPIVSIPFRVLVGFLRSAIYSWSRTRDICFNPFQGFGGVSAGTGCGRGVAGGC